jgi:hypothetical protein
MDDGWRMESGKSQATGTILYVRNVVAGKHETYAAMEARRSPTWSARISVRVGRSKQLEGSMADDNTPYPEEGHAEGRKGQPYASPAEACNIAMTRSERRRWGWGFWCGENDQTRLLVTSLGAACGTRPSALSQPSRGRCHSVALQSSASHPSNHSPAADLARV